MAVKHEVIFCIVNAGYSPLVMDAARGAGAQGGTVIHARGTANKEAESYFNIPIQPEKEIVMILVPATIKDAVLHALYRSVGLNTAGQGIAFSVPATQVVGLTGEATHVHKKTANAPVNTSATTPANTPAPEEGATTFQSQNGNGGNL